MSDRERLAEVLAEPLCAAICDLLGEPRILVPGEVSALLARVTRQPDVADALAGMLAEARAEAWDDGYEAGHEDARAVQRTYPNLTRNPYRAALTAEDAP